jgi:hypothetical protein
MREGFVIRAILFVAFVSGLFWSSTLPFAAEKIPVGAILGRPDPSLGFVDKIVKESFPVNGANYEMNWTTQLLSILANSGITQVSLVEAISDDGNLSMDVMFDALRLSARRANVVFAPIGGPPESENQICAVASSLPDSVFVFSAGMGSSRIDGDSDPECLASNIIRVAALNEIHSSLLSRSNFGLGIQLAAPGENVKVIGEGGAVSVLSSASAAAAIVVSAISHYQVDHPTVGGGHLVDAFFKEKTVSLPFLKGLIKNERAFF